MRGNVSGTRLLKNRSDLLEKLTFLASVGLQMAWR